jgi:hypothetical protein
VLDVSAQSDTGLVSGTFHADGVGRFAFTGSESDGVLTLVFDGAAGGGSIVAALDSTDGNMLHGAFTDQIGAVIQTGSIRLVHQGSSSSSTPATPTLLVPATGTIAPSDISGALSGTVRFTGDNADALGTARQRTHATLHVDTIGSDSVISGSFRLDRIGRYRFSGFLGGNGLASIVFSNGSGSGSLVLHVNVNTSVLTPSLTAPVVATGGSRDGKIFAHVGGFDLHGIARLNNGGIVLAGTPIITPPAAAVPTGSGSGITETTTTVNGGAGNLVDLTGGDMTGTNIAGASTDLSTGAIGAQTSTVGSVTDTIGAPTDTIGGDMNTIGAPINTVGADMNTIGATINTVGSPIDTIGSTFDTIGMPPM